MPALESVVGVRIVATPAAIDGATYEPSKGLQLWRTSPDEGFAWHPERPPTVILDDPEAIIEPEHGFVRALLTPSDLEDVRRHVEYPLPTDLPALVQGKVAGVPARLALFGDSAILLVHAAYADELRERLGW